MHAEALRGRRILVFEGDAVFVEDLRARMAERGGEVIGSAADVNTASRMIQNESRIDGAILDLHLKGGAVAALAEDLIRRRIPFVILNSQDRRPGLQDGDEFDSGTAEQALGMLAARMIARHSEAGTKLEAPVADVRSRLLQRMTPEQFGALAPSLRRVELKQREFLFREGETIPAVYFPETAVLAASVASAGSRAIDVGIVGCEGMTDFVLCAGDKAALRWTVLVGGSALRMDASDFAEAMRRVDIDRFVLGYKEALSVQFAYAALSHGTSTIDARLARWILMLHDRLEGDAIPIVHTHIAEALAVRRSGVTTALHLLEGKGAIKSIRGMLIVRDRSILEELASTTYGPPEAEYRRIMARISGDPGTQRRG